MTVPPDDTSDWIKATPAEVELFTTLRHLPPEVRSKLTAALDAHAPPEEADDAAERLRVMLAGMRSPMAELAAGVRLLGLLGESTRIRNLRPWWRWSPTSYMPPWLSCGRLWVIMPSPGGPPHDP